MENVFLEFCYRLVNLRRELRGVHHLAYARAYVDENHDYAVALQLYAWFELGWQEARSGEEALCCLLYYIIWPKVTSSATRAFYMHWLQQASSATLSSRKLPYRGPM